MRKTWKKPKLFVLVRGSHGENVLGECKGLGIPDIGAVIEQTDCIQNLVNCQLCQALGGS